MSSLGDGLRYVAFPLLAAGLSSDPRAVAVVFVAGFLPWPLFGLLAGAVVDRNDRRAVLWSGNALRASVGCAFTVVLFTGTVSVGSLAVLSFLLGTLETLCDNAASAIVPELVAIADLGPANSRLIGAQILNSTLLGAPLGALLYGVARYLPTAAEAASFGVAAWLVWSLPGQDRPLNTASRRSLVSDIGVGIRWLLDHRLLRTACLLLVVINGTLAAGEAVLVLYARQTLGLSNLGYTALLVVLALGGIAATLLAPALRRRASLRTVIVLAALGQAAALVAAGITTSGVVTAVAMTILGACNATWNVVTVSYRQAVAPGDLLGRVTSSYRVVAYSSMPLGAAVGGVTARTWGLHAPYLAGGIMLAVTTVATFPTLRDAAENQGRPTLNG